MLEETQDNPLSESIRCVLNQPVEVEGTEIRTLPDPGCDASKGQETSHEPTETKRSWHARDHPLPVRLVVTYRKRS